MGWLFGLFLGENLKSLKYQELIQQKVDIQNVIKALEAQNAECSEIDNAKEILRNIIQEMNSR